ncbi:MAG TPA: ABC transporter permease [Thermodesulfobacteriota bacterium]
MTAGRPVDPDGAPAASRWRPALEPLAALLRDRTAAVGLAIVLGFVLVAVAAPWLAPYDAEEQHIADALQGPSATYRLGTDEYGRDLLSRVIYGTRPALLIGVLSVLLSMAIGIPLGILAGYRMGWVDRATSWFVDLMLSFPSLLMALLIVTLLGPGQELTVIVAIGLSHVPVFVRLARASTLVVKNLDFITASRAFGSRDARIMCRHIMPNILGPIVIMGTLSIAGAIRQEASLSFLGLGIQPPAPSWGNMIREGTSDILQSPWVAVVPGAFLSLSVFAFNMIGDALRDLLDPRGLTSNTRTRPSGRRRP